MATYEWMTSPIIYKITLKPTKKYRIDIDIIQKILEKTKTEFDCDRIYYNYGTFYITTKNQLNKTEVACYLAIKMYKYGRKEILLT